MNQKSLFRVVALVLFLAVSVAVMMAKSESDTECNVNPEYIIGDWFAQIDIPQNEMTIQMEMNIIDGGNCMIKCTWSGPYPTEEESGNARWKLDGNKLIITFPNEEERIRTDHIFGMENIYDITLAKERLVIVNNRQFRNVDVNFGRGYENRGFAEIIFPEDD